MALEVGAELFHRLEIVFEVLGFAFGVVEGDVVAEWAVEIDLGRLLLEDGEHDVCGGA